jgi:hypothetical protein
MRCFALHLKKIVACNNQKNPTNPKILKILLKDGNETRSPNPQNNMSEVGFLG